MSVKCKQITFDMDDGEQEWKSIMSLEELINLEIEQRFTPENFGEEIVIRIQRRTQQSKEYANYIRRVSNLNF